MANKRVVDTPNNIPGTVRVGSVTYRVILDAAEIKAASDDQNLPRGAEWIAFCDHDKLIIGLNPAHAPDANRKSLLHELLHCALRQSGSHPNTYADTVYEARDRNGGVTVEEYTVAAMAGPLLSVLRDNPDLITHLTAAR